MLNSIDKQRSLSANSSDKVVSAEEEEVLCTRLPRGNAESGIAWRRTVTIVALLRCYCLPGRPNAGALTY